MSTAGAGSVSAGKSGLMDMLAGGHVDDVTFRQAIELLRAEDWESLRLLLAGEHLCSPTEVDTSVSTLYCTRQHRPINSSPINRGSGACRSAW